jgi:type I restriction enzyme R subunit
MLRERNSFTRDDGTPLNYTLVNIKDWCKNRFEVVNQLRINTDYSHHRYDLTGRSKCTTCGRIKMYHPRGPLLAVKNSEVK